MDSEVTNKKQSRADLIALTICKYGPYVVVVIAAMCAFSAFADYELRVDGSVVGGLWQFIWGDHVEYSGLTIRLPRHWVAVRRPGREVLLGVANRNTAQVFFGAFEKDKRIPPDWVELILAAHKSEGYESVTPPAISALGEPVTCVYVVSLNNKAVQVIDCGIDGGRMLVEYLGTESDIPQFISLMGALQRSGAQINRSQPHREYVAAMRNP